MRGASPVVSLSPNQCQAIINDIAVAASAAELDELRRLMRQQYGRDLDGSFAELLMDFRLEKLCARVRDQVRATR